MVKQTQHFDKTNTIRLYGIKKKLRRERIQKLKEVKQKHQEIKQEFEALPENKKPLTQKTKKQLIIIGVACVMIALIFIGWLI